jgi:alkyl hydroperoxide reductase subunit AhpC
LCERHEEFSRLNTRVFIVSFGSFPAVQQWMGEVCGTFTILLDRDRTAYKAYRLERSRLRVWHPRVLWVYIKRWFQRERFYESHGDDTSQLGGDFLVDRNGLLQLLHPSHDPTDRPEVSELLKVIKSLPG